MKVKSESEVAQSYPTLCDTMDCSPPGSSGHGILQARVLEWVAIAFSNFWAYKDQFLTFPAIFPFSLSLYLYTCMHVYMYIYLHIYRLHCVACGILIPQWGIEPMPTAVESHSLNHWTTREVCNLSYINFLSQWKLASTMTSSLKLFYQGPC